MVEGERVALARGIQAVPASLPRTCSPERLAEFLHRSAAARTGQPRLGYPASYLRWLAAIPGRDSYMDAVLIDDERNVVGAAITRPLTLGMWANMKLRAAITEVAAEDQQERAQKKWVRYLTRERDRDLAAALSALLPEEHYALRAVVVEFLQVDPRLVGQGYERLLLDVVLDEARAAGCDYLLCWGDGSPPLPTRAPRAAEAVLEALPEEEAGLLRLYNLARAAARALRLWARALRDAALRQARAAGVWLRAAPGRLWRDARERLRGRVTSPPDPLSAAAERGTSPLTPLPAGDGRGTVLLPSPTSGEGVEMRAGARPILAAASTVAAELPSSAGPAAAAPPAASAPAPTLRPRDEAITFDGIVVRRLGGPSLPLDAAALARVRELMAATNDHYGIFPTYGDALLQTLLAPSRAEARFTQVYTLHRHGDRSVLTAGEAHDVLSYLATAGGRAVALVFGHRLPWFPHDGEPTEAFVVRAAYFAPGLGSLSRADVLQRCAEAAGREYGIQRLLLLRAAGLRGRLFSRTLLGTRRAAERQALSYIPLSEQARSEVAVLERPVPIGYV